MNLLIDTHIFLWWIALPKKLSQSAIKGIENPDNEVFVSSAALWEIVIKKELGKLKAPDNLIDIIEENNFSPLSISMEHVDRLKDLPPIHNDPFDRIQIAQCLSEQLTFVTMDKNIIRYPIEYLS